MDQPSGTARVGGTRTIDESPRPSPSALVGPGENRETPGLARLVSLPRNADRPIWDGRDGHGPGPPPALLALHLEADGKDALGMLTSYLSPGSYVSMATPVVLISLLTSFNGTFGPSSRNRRFPVPSTIGSTHRS